MIDKYGPNNEKLKTLNLMAEGPNNELIFCNFSTDQLVIFDEQLQYSYTCDWRKREWKWKVSEHNWNSNRHQGIFVCCRL